VSGAGLPEALARLAGHLGLVGFAVPVDGAGRAAEQRAGRTAAATALQAAGSKVLHVAADDAGRPCWPPGFVGSIAHTAAWAVAVTGRLAPALTVGVDIEAADALATTDAHVVLRADEQMAAARAARPDDMATLLWSAKEATYKAWSARWRGAIEPVDPLDIAITVTGERIEARAHGALAAVVGPATLTGGWSAADGHVLTVVTSG
jgi:enterobactin synthetase component D